MRNYIYLDGQLEEATVEIEREDITTDDGGWVVRLPGPAVWRVEARIRRRLGERVSVRVARDGFSDLFGVAQVTGLDEISGRLQMVGLGQLAAV